MSLFKKRSFICVALLGSCLPLVAESQATGNATDPFGYASDLNAYVNDVTVNPSRPGALEVAQAKAIDECGWIMLDPNYTQLEIARLKDTQSKLAPYQIKAHESMQTRCQNFALHTSLKFKDGKALYNKAANLSNPEAIAHNLGYGMYISKLSSAVAYAKTMEVIKSNDPVAWFRLSYVLGDDGPFAASAGKEIGTPASTNAWQLVACDHGVNCSANSPVVELACIMRGICGPGDFRSNLQVTLSSAQEFQDVTTAEARINQALANGTVATLINHR